MSKVFKIFNEHKPFIGRIIGKYLSNASDVEELTQETFLRVYAYELKGEIREPERFLYRTAKNLAISFLLIRRAFLSAVLALAAAFLRHWRFGYGTKKGQRLLVRC